MTKPLYPKEIFVKLELDGNQPWYNAEADRLTLVEEDETTEVATYVLKEVKRCRRTVEYLDD
jgi:fructosamine-3-kinase